MATIDIDALIVELSADESRKLPSNDRFHHALALATKKVSSLRATATTGQIADLPVRFKKTSSTATFVFDNKSAPGFDQFVQDRLQDLFQEFKKDKGA